MRGRSAGDGWVVAAGRPGEVGQLPGRRARPEGSAARPAKSRGGRGAVSGAPAGKTDRGGDRVELTVTEITRHQKSKA